MNMNIYMLNFHDSYPWGALCNSMHIQSKRIRNRQRADIYYLPQTSALIDKLPCRVREGAHDGHVEELERKQRIG